MERNPLMLRRLWANLVECAKSLAVAEPILSPYLKDTIISANSPEEGIANVLALKLSPNAVSSADLTSIYLDILKKHPGVVDSLAQDLSAVLTRDHAAAGPLHVLLNQKGFHALESHRMANALWRSDRRDLALFLAQESTTAFAVDIHPAAAIGSGVMMDHGTGVVIGETAVVGNDVSMLHGVTLGGTGKVSGDRHPKIRDGVFIGAGAMILGNIEVGMLSKVGAGSVVLNNVPARTTVCGVPAKIVRRHVGNKARSDEMDPCLSGDAFAVGI